MNQAPVWRMLPSNPSVEAYLARDLKVHPLVARLLFQRGFTTSEAAHAFLHPRLEDLSDPFQLPDAELACDRLQQALSAHQRILIHGDYDSDGVTSTALWVRALRRLGADVHAFVPHRKRDGYDLRRPAIESAAKQGVKLIVTTDCGIHRVDEVEYARASGIDVIITDHHLPGAEQPRAVAVVNPHLPGSRCTFKDLAGVGVAFRLCEALSTRLGYPAAQFRRAFLDLAAIGTVSDVMPLRADNRIIVRHGLQSLQQSQKVGLQALIAVAGYRDRPLDSEAIGFGLGPRLNSAGRMDDPQIALDLLLSNDRRESEELARRIDDLNTERKGAQQSVLEAALAQAPAESLEGARCLVLCGRDWPMGVIGIVAGKVAELTNRPCILLALDGDLRVARGSARSIPAFHMLKAIEQCAPLLLDYGGHAHAAGLSIKEDSIASFAQQMDLIARSALADADLAPTLDVAAEIPAHEITEELLESVRAFEPFGEANTYPLFASRGLLVQSISKMGAEGKHLRLRLAAPDGAEWGSVEAPWFGRGELAPTFSVSEKVDVCFHPELRRWNGQMGLRFVLEDVRR